MSGDVPDTPPPRRTDGGGSPLAWALPLALTALVIVLAWKLYQSIPRDAHDPGAQARPVVARGDLAADEKSTIDLFRAASPAVVQVTAFRGTDRIGMDGFARPIASGSGFVWDPQGYVVTNFHVVNAGRSYTVTFPNHDVFDALRVGVDEVHDLAVLKVDAHGKTLPTLPIGKSSELLVGQKVFAIGNPFGLDQTLTTGIISGLNREITAPPPAQTPIRGVIQTDAAINPGNSGGPLLDSSGRVIGLNTQIASPSGGSSGVGFAIPVDTINRVVPQIIRTGHAVRPGLGIGEMYEGVVGRDGRRGVVFCRYTPTSAARAAGIRATTLTEEGEANPLGDVIVAIGDQPVEATADLFRILDAREIGDEVEVRYLRDGKEQSAKVKLVGVE